MQKRVYAEKMCIYMRDEFMCDVCVCLRVCLCACVCVCAAGVGR